MSKFQVIMLAFIFPVTAILLYVAFISHMKDKSVSRYRVIYTQNGKTHTADFDGYPLRNTEKCGFTVWRNGLAGTPDFECPDCCLIQAKRLDDE